MSDEPRVPPPVVPPTQNAPPPTQQPSHYTVPISPADYEPVYTMPRPQPGDQPPPLPPRRQEGNLMDLTTPPPTGQSAPPTSNDLMGLSDIQSATEQAQLSTGSSDPTGPPAPSLPERTASMMESQMTPYNMTAGSEYESDPFGLDDILPRPSTDQQQMSQQPPSVGVPPQQQPLQQQQPPQQQLPQQDPPTMGQDPFSTSGGTNPFN